MDLFKATVLYGEFTGASALEKQGGAKGRPPSSARRATITSGPTSAPGCSCSRPRRTSAPWPATDDRFGMMELLASLYYDAGKDRDAALAYSFLIKEKPLIAKTPGWQSRIVDCVLRAGDKKQTVAQIRKLVKVIGDVEKSGNVKTDADRKAMGSAKISPSAPSPTSPSTGTSRAERPATTTPSSTPTRSTRTT
jgi:hypothetical protein